MIGVTRDLQYYFSNPFYSRDISYDDMAAFGTDTVGRMVARILTELNLLIAPLQSSLTNFMGTISGDSGKGALRKMAKANKDGYRDFIYQTLDTAKVEVRFALRDEPETALLEFIPNGVTEFRKQPDEGVAPELDRFLAALQNRSDKVDPATTSNWQALIAGWTAVYTASESSTAEKAMSENERRAARTAVANELFTVPRALIGIFPDEPEQIGLYMQQSLLGGPSVTTPPGTGGGGGGGNPSSDSNEDESESSMDSQPSSTSSFSSSFSSSSSSEQEPPQSSSFPSSSSTSGL